MSRLLLLMACLTQSPRPCAAEQPQRQQPRIRPSVACYLRRPNNITAAEAPVTVTSESCILHVFRYVLKNVHAASLLENANLLNAIEFLHTARNVSSMEDDAHPGDDLSRDVLRASV